MTSLPNYDKGFGLERESDYSNDPKKKKYDRNMIFSNQKIQEMSIDTGDASLEKSNSIMNKKRKKKNRDTDDSSYSERKEARKTVKDYDINVILTDQEKPSLILYKYRWVVLFTFFLTSSSTGVLTGSLSTNRDIIVKFQNDLTKSTI